MSDYQAMQAIVRPQGEWHEVENQIVDQAQVDALVDWAGHHAAGPVDIWVRTAEDSPRTWRIGCYGWPDAMPATDMTKLVHERNIYYSDNLLFGFAERTDALRFKLLPQV